MFFLNSQIPNVKDYILSKYGLVLITGMHPTFNLNIRGELIDTYTIDNPNPIYIEFEDSIVYSGIDGKCYEINLNTKSKKLINENSKNLSVINHRGADFLITTNEGGRHAEIIDIKTLETQHKFKTLIGLQHFATDFYYSVSGAYNKIFCLSAETYKQLWEFDVSEIGRWTNSKGEHLKGEIVSVIGLWNNLLLLHVTDNKIVAINSSGTLEWEIENILLPEEQLFFPYEMRTDIVATVRWLINKQHGKLYLLGSHYLFEFDLQSRERTILKNYSGDESWFFKAGVLNENNILFSGYKQMSGYPDHIGIIDLLQNEIIWEYKNEGNGYFISYPIMYENRLYIKDNRSILYEFKKDNERSL